MTQPLFALVFSEVFVILVLLFRTPLRNLLVILLDRTKQGSGPVIVSTVGGTLFVIMLSLVYSLTDIQNRSEEGVLNTTDEVLFANQLLQASLLGFALFLALMIDRIHYYVKEVGMLRKHLEALKMSDRKSEEDKGKSELEDEDDD